jgi:UDP-N-acetylmuramoyl-L-alanyl-D-glutamate--2,6-diaminopimelate ligase
MKTPLKQLIQSIGLTCSYNIDIYGLAFDSRKVKKGFLFFAISGNESDGHNYIKSAIRNGAAAIVGEKELDEEIPIPYFRVDNSRKYLTILANQFYEMPHKKHKLIGITGTNGKTTTAYMLHHILNHNGKTASLLGTAGNYLNGEKYESNLTTPDPISLQKMMYDSHDEFVLMEVSSHGLDQHRVFGPMFDYALFTNLSHEHLDYHDNLEEYYQTKKKLFRCLKENGKGIIGAYTNWGERLYQELAEELVSVSSFANKVKNEPIQLKSVNPGHNTALLINDHEKEVRFKLKTPGLHNALNAFGSYICSRDLGFEPQQIIEALEHFEGAPGRFDIIHIPTGAKAIIDYAHTSDGLTHALITARQFIEHNLYHIFGFRGKRDLTKREEMVRISQFLSNYVILTLDDLNGVDQDMMLDELNILSRPYKNVVVIEDRTEAIAYALHQLKKEDGLIITGKGYENYKETFSMKTISDKDTIHKILSSDFGVN